MNSLKSEITEEYIERIYNPISEDLFIRYSDKLEGQSF